MLKRIIQQIIPDFILRKYKQRTYFNLILDFDINDEPDLIVAQSLVNEDSVFVDIGANIGLYTRFLSPFSRKVISFEPVPFTFSILSNTVFKFKLENVELHQIAISDKDGKATIEVPLQSGVFNYFRASITEINSDHYSHNKVTAKTKAIDTLFLNKVENISLIKCDVEGHELACINGALKYLQKFHPAWLIEISEDPDNPGTSSAKLFEIMRGFEYKIYLFEDGLLRLREPGDKSINYFFLQKFHLKSLKQSNIKIEF